MATAADRRGPGPERAFASDLPAGGEVVLDPDESAHLVRSRRVPVGAAVVLFDGMGTTCLGRLRTADPRAAVVEVEGPHPARVPSRRVHLVVSLPEPARADAMVAALAELGVRQLTPMLCARTGRGREALAERRAKRWVRAAREALKVNGCAHAMRILPTGSFESLLHADAVLLDPDPRAAPLASVLGTREAPRPILVGPEGGFIEAELDAAAQCGVPVARLGAAALRTGTAAVAAAAVALS